MEIPSSFDDDGSMVKDFQPGMGEMLPEKQVAPVIAQIGPENLLQ